MTNSVENIADNLFKVVKGFGHAIVLFTDEGKKTVSPTDARRFYIKDLKIMINFVADETTNEVVVNLSQGTDIKAIKPMLNAIRTLANRHIIEYTVKTFGKSITPRDFSYMAKNTVQESSWGSMQPEGAVKQLKNKTWWAKNLEGNMTVKSDEQQARAFAKTGNPDNAPKVVDEGKWDYPKPITKSKETSDMGTTNSAENRKKRKEWRQKQKAAQHAKLMTKTDESVFEGFSGWTGSSRKSVNELGDARIIVRHKRTVDEEKRGARTRQIESIFIENAEGERFKFPSTNITAAKAMARHVKEGGAPHDEFGQHIYGIMEELTQLKKFQRTNKRNDFFEDVAIGQEIGSHIGNLRHNLKTMASPNGYKNQMESFSKEQSDVPQERIDELKDVATISYFDEGITDSLPYVARIIESLRSRQAKEADVFEFAKYVMKNKDNMQLNSPIDDNDPESPGSQNFRDPATEFAAWATYLAPKMSDDSLSNMIMQVSDLVHTVGPKHVKMAVAAAGVIRQHAKVNESADMQDNGENLSEVEFGRISESLDKYDIRKLFGV